ncbi:hypothetical protein WK59_21415 [Burkholderia ubonensis]|uniref:gp53-like domain-containing protein n=1 Tax=Burkholderia ubonensis TaxID=101571 RepID=UPI000753C771|nr:hypothetical protein [Burkholderia ubonensis]KVT80597.1 hypothetical protein WK59_21415 [Burkholderia ubonensis]
MTDLVESSTWTPGIRQFETSDPVEGGPDGIDNVPLRQLANRTRFLKDAHDALAGAQNPYPQYATTVQMQAAISALVDAAPGALDTLNELSKALGNDPNFATTMANALALKAPIDSPVFTGTPKGPTPPQFDSSDRLASTGFVQHALGNMQIGTRIQSAANAIFSASHAGGSYTLEVASTTYALPSLASVKPGATFEFLATVNAATVATAGADKMMTGSLVSSSTCVLNNGDTAKFVSDGTYWVLVSGSAALRLSLGDFGNSLSANGYQKLPSGLIIQWGVVGTNGTADTQVIFPVGYQRACYSVVASPNSNLSGGTFDSPFGITVSGFWVGGYQCSGSPTIRSAHECRWMAIGY